ncbi:MAG TPA: universal stress protein [Candidatus Marinimicrobia bacterium]|nr:universal stress protein [Candidatus Neomarinimicrobiota bacterium]
MISEPKRIMVALVARGDEKPVIEQAVLMAEKFNAQLVAIHVHLPILSQPKGTAGITVTEEIIRSRFTEYGFEHVVDELEIIIANSDNIPQKIHDHIGDIDMLIVGHKKMGGFVARIMDSIDEGISNLIPCPVLVVQKD